MKSSQKIMLLSVLASGIALQAVAQPAAAAPPQAPELTLSVNRESRLTISPGTPLVFEVLLRNAGMAGAANAVEARRDLEKDLASLVEAGKVSRKEADRLLAGEAAPVAVGPMTVALNAGSFSLVSAGPEGDTAVPWQSKLVEPATATAVALDEKGIAYVALVVAPEQTASTAAGTYRVVIRFESNPADRKQWRGKVVSDPVAITVEADSATPTAEQQERKQLAFVQYHLALKNYDRALDAARKALTVAPQSIGALVLLGRAQEGKGDLRAAFETYQKALDAFYGRYPKPDEPPVVLMSNVRRMRNQLGIKLPDLPKRATGRGQRPPPQGQPQIQHAARPAAPVPSTPPPAQPTPGAGLAEVGARPPGKAIDSLEADRQRQWPVTARASSQHGASNGSARQALGPPDTLKYGDALSAWTPNTENGGIEWLEVTYQFAVIPLSIEVYESSAAGAITRVMMRPEGDQAEWITLFEQSAPGGQANAQRPVVTTVDASKVAKPTRTVRVEINTAVPGWNEIDTVALIGRYAVGAAAAGLSTGVYRWWAESAMASSQYGDQGNSAQQALGMPDTQNGRDRPTAWAPKTRDGGSEWLEVSYPRAIAPTELRIHESYGPGFVTRLEAWDEQAARWTTVWEGQDPTRIPGVFAPPLTALPVGVRTFRIHVNAAVPDWNEIDAVELVGN